MRGRSLANVSPTTWRVTVVAVALASLLVRLVLVAHSHGGADLRIYTYFSRLALHGVNPYTAPANGAIPGSYGDSPPVEVGLFTGLLALHDSTTTLRVVFALADATVVLLVGLWFPRSRRWRVGFILFYGFNPFVLVCWTVFAEDKPLLFLGIAAWVLALERRRDGLAWVAATFLTVFKFLGSFAVPSMALHSWRTRPARALIPVTAFVVCSLLSNLPWFPHSLDAFSRRNARLNIDPPIHASPTIVLARLGVYAPIEAKLLTASAIVLVFVLFVTRRIDVREAVVWSIFGGYLFLPDEAFNRVLLITLPLLLLVSVSVARWTTIWAVSSVSALGVWITERGVPHALSPIGGSLRAVFGHESTPRHVIWMNLTLLLVLVFYLADRRAELAPVSRDNSATARRRTGTRRAPKPTYRSTAETGAADHEPTPR